MTERERFDQILERLSSGRAAIRCRELAELLTSLGFELRDGRKAGHKVFVHHGVASFTSAAYTCGHGRNPEVKPVYVNNVARLLKQYEAELTQYLRENP
jgi:hypothetical protein